MMTPTRLRGSKNYRFDRICPGVGRIRRSSRTSSKREFRRRDAVLTKLIEGGHVETLRLFNAGKISIEELVDADRSGRLHRIAQDLVLGKSLIASIDAWLPVSATAKHSRRRYATSWRRFQKHARLTPVTTIQELRVIDYSALWKTWDASAADWNRARACVSRFLTQFLGHVHHPFRLEVMQRYGTKGEPEGRMPRVTPARFWKIVEAADERCQPSYAAMAILGVGPAEYLALTRDHLYPEEHLVDVHGTKTRHRRRLVAVDPRLWEWVDAAVPSPLHYRWLNNYWHRACEVVGVTDLRMYDLRHLSAQYAGDKGATDRDLTVHLGHSDPKMSHRYSRVAIVRSVAKAAADRFLETG